MSIPKRTERRIIDGTKSFRPSLEEAKARDIDEADTVTIVKSVLADVFGWDPFFEVTSEYRIRGTYVDLAEAPLKKFKKADRPLRALLAVGVLTMYLGSLYRHDHRRRIMDAGPPKVRELRARIGAIGEVAAALDRASQTQDREVVALKRHVQRLEAQHNQLVGAVDLLSRQPIPAGGSYEGDG